MTERLEVSFTPRALKHLADAKRWWRENRSKAPTALIEELETAMELIATQPDVGAIARNLRLVGIRRVYLSRVRYFLYYRVREGAVRAVEVVGFWHASRGTGPHI